MLWAEKLISGKVSISCWVRTCHRWQQSTHATYLKRDCSFICIAKEWCVMWKYQSGDIRFDLWWLVLWCLARFTYVWLITSNGIWWVSSTFVSEWVSEWMSEWVSEWLLDWINLLDKESLNERQMVLTRTPNHLLKQLDSSEWRRKGTVWWGG